MKYKANIDSAIQATFLALTFIVISFHREGFLLVQQYDSTMTSFCIIRGSYADSTGVSSLSVNDTSQPALLHRVLIVVQLGSPSTDRNI